MTRTVLARLAAASALLLTAGAQARASAIDWSYHFSATPNITWTGGPGTGVVLIPGTGGSSNMSGDADIVTKVWTVSTATQADPQKVDVPFSIVLHLHDKEGGLSGALTFTGELKGTVWDTGSDLKVVINSDDSATKQTLHLAPNLYDVTFKTKDFETPTGNGPGNFGEFVFHVHTHPNPEPSTLVLAVLGAPLFGAFYRRSRRRLRW